jgi:hypothetical protein
MKRLIALGAVALALASGHWLSVSASRMSRPDKQRLVFKRHHAGAHTRSETEWTIAPQRGASIGVIVGAAVCGDEAFLLDRQRAAVHRADLRRGVIVEDLGLPQNGSPGLREVTSLAADCARRALYVVDHNGVSAIDMDSGRVSARFAKPTSFVNSVAGTALDADAQVLSVSGLWPAAPNDWLVKPVDRMFEGDRLGYRLDLRTGQTAPLVAAVERGCWSLGPNCLFASVDAVSAAAGGGWIAAHSVGMLVGVYDRALRQVRTVDVRSPMFLDSGERNGSQSLTNMVAWNEDNSVIRGVYAFDDAMVSVHSFNRTRSWKPGQRTDFHVFMNVHRLDGTGVTSDVRLPDVPVGRDATSLYVVDYGPGGRRPIGRDPISLMRIPIDRD